MSPDLQQPKPTDEHMLKPKLGDTILGKTEIGIVEMSVVEPLDTDPFLPEGWVMMGYKDLEGQARRIPVHEQAFNPDIQEKIRSRMRVSQGLGEASVAESVNVSHVEPNEASIEPEASSWEIKPKDEVEQQRLRGIYESQTPEERLEGQKLLSGLSGGKYKVEDLGRYCDVDEVEFGKVQLAKYLMLPSGEVSGRWFKDADAVFMNEDGTFSIRGLYRKGDTFELADESEVERLTSERKESNRVPEITPPPSFTGPIQEPYIPDRIDSMRYNPRVIPQQ